MCSALIRRNVCLKLTPTPPHYKHPLSWPDSTKIQLQQNTQNKFNLIYRNITQPCCINHTFTTVSLSLLCSPQNKFFPSDKPLGSLRSREACSINNSGQSDVVSRATHAKTKEHRDGGGRGVRWRVAGGLRRLYSSMRPENWGVCHESGNRTNCGETELAAK